MTATSVTVPERPASAVRCRIAASSSAEPPQNATSSHGSAPRASATPETTIVRIPSARSIQ